MKKAVPFPTPFGERHYPRALAYIRSGLAASFARLDTRPNDEQHQAARMYVCIYADVYFDLVYNAWVASDPPFRAQLAAVMAMIVAQDAPQRMADELAFAVPKGFSIPHRNAMHGAIESVREWTIDDATVALTTLRLLADTSDLVFAWMESHAAVWGSADYSGSNGYLYAHALSAIGRGALAESPILGITVDAVNDLLLIPADPI